MTALDMQLLVRPLADELRRRGHDATPIADPTENVNVDNLYRLDPVDADAYVARLLIHAAKRLRDVEDGVRLHADPFRHARVALGAHAHLVELQTGVAA
jgi:hypothetical protein